MPGWLPPARQNFLLFQCIGDAVNFHHVWATPGIKGGGAWFCWPSISISRVPL